MRKIKTEIFFMICFVAALSLQGCSGGGGGGGGGQAPSSVSLSPMSGTVSQGAEFTRTVEVSNVGRTYYIAFDVTYDPNVIQYEDAVEDTFLSRGQPNSTFFDTALENGAQGRIIIGLTRVQGGDVSGSGTLLTLKFKATGLGTATLALTDPKALMNSSNQSVAISTWKDATVTVVPPAAP